MGMESEIIADSQITISNQMTASSASARMNTKLDGLCSKEDLYVEINLKNIMMVDAVAVKGSSKFKCREYIVKSYEIYLGNGTNNIKSNIGVSILSLYLNEQNFLPMNFFCKLLQFYHYYLS